MEIEDLMVGTSEPFRVFLDELGRVAGSDVGVLIEGEHGTGKSLAARALHRFGSRSAGPLVEVQPAALAPSLLEAELFGHEEGAFTGAHRARVGRFQRASGGTLVLDGVEALPSEVQVKLLRVLQERVVEPLGSEQAVPIDARVVATSARDLRGEVEAGRFGQDLYFRLAVVTLHLPPLRARIEDLDALVEHLGVTVAARAGVPGRTFTAGARQRLAEHSWPGNVRELENALERLSVLAPERLEHQGAAGERPAVAAAELDFLQESVAGAAERLAAEALAQGLCIDDMGLAMMRAALRENRGNLSAAARRVGLSRRALEYRLAKAEEDGQPVDDPVEDPGE